MLRGQKQLKTRTFPYCEIQGGIWPRTRQVCTQLLQHWSPQNTPCLFFLRASLSTSVCHTGIAPQGSWRESKVFAKLNEDPKLVSVRHFPHIPSFFRGRKQFSVICLYHDIHLRRKKGDKPAKRKFPCMRQMGIIGQKSQQNQLSSGLVVPAAPRWQPFQMMLMCFRASKPFLHYSLWETQTFQNLNVSNYSLSLEVRFHIEEPNKQF